MNQAQEQPYDVYNLKETPERCTEEFMRWRLDATDLVKEVERFLRGQIWSETDKSYITPKDTQGKPIKPLANEAGIARLCTMVRIQLERNITLSNYDEEDILRLAKQYNNCIRELLADCYQSFGIDMRMLQYIRRNLDSIFYSNLKRAFGAGERNSIGRSHTTSEQIMMRQMQEREESKRFAFFR